MWKVLILTICCSIIIAKYIEDDMLLFWRRANSKSCKPFTTYIVDCNRCVCGADGVEFCTRMACRREKTISVDSEYSDRDK